LSAANSNLPSPASDLSTLISASSNKGFSAKEMVALSGLSGFTILVWVWSNTKSSSGLTKEGCL
ncbi:peroxidase, partial [Sarracenia purpurea var. burkii]